MAAAHKLQAPVRSRAVLLVAGSDLMCCAHVPGVLSQASMRVTMLAPATNVGLGSRHVAERLPVQGSAKAVLRELRRLLTAEPARFDWVILGDDDIVAAVADHLSEPWAQACFPVGADVEAARVVSRKTVFVAACQEAGIPVPESRVCSDSRGALAAAQSIGYPLLMKADFGASGTTVWRIDDAAGLVGTLPKTAGRPFTMQALIVGEVGVTDMLCTSGRPIAVVSSLMRGIDPAPFGPSSSRLYRKNPQAEALAVRIAAMTGFRGFCGFDWVQSGGAESRLHVIEFHARPTLGLHMAKHAGVCFSEAARRMFQTPTAPLAEQPAGREASCHFFPKDLVRALHARDLRGLARWLPGRSRTDFPWRDAGLLGALLQRFIRGRARSSRNAGTPIGASTFGLTRPSQFE